MYGISMRETESICKDDNGFIWASSKTGILRLAGDYSHVYQLSYQSTDIVTVKLVYEEGVLLAYTNNGQVFQYNTLYDRFDILSYAGRMLEQRHLYVHTLFIDHQGDLWISSTHGLYRHRNGEWTLMGDDISEVISAIRKDDRHIVYIKNDEIRLIDIENLETDCIYKNDVLASIRISALYYEKGENKLWIGTMSDGLFYFDFNEKAFVKLPVRFFPGQPVRSVEACTDSTFLVGIDGQGIWEINKQESRVCNIYKENVDDLFSLRGNGVYDIFHDRDKRRIWVCTYTGGLSFFDQNAPLVSQIVHQVNNPNSLTNNNVNRVLEDSRRNLWFATENGICRWEVQSDKWTAFYHNRQERAQAFLSLCEDDEGRIWASSYSSGVYVIDGTTGKELAHYSRETQGLSLSSNFVFDIYKDSEGDLWLGGVRGDAMRYVSKENTFMSYPQLPVYAYTELQPGQILAACTYGLCLLDKATGEAEVLLGEYLLRDLLVIGDDVWLCCGSGLIRFNLKNRTTEKFTVESGLPSNFINSIEWKDGFLWLGTENGLCRFDPKDNSTQIYSSLLSLSNLSVNYNSHCKLYNGQLLFGTNNGAILFDPNALQQMQSEGRIFFQDLTVSGRSIRDPSVFNLTAPLDSLNEVTLNYNQNNLTLEMLPLGNMVSGARFSWKMEGQDAEWSQPSGRRTITYTNIPAGRFELKMKMYDNSLSQVIAERRLFIRITPPFWATLRFRILICILVIGVIYFSLRYYIDRLKQRHIEDKIRFFTNTAHDIRTSLTLIKAPVEELSKESTLSETGKHYLHLATEQVMQLSSVATRLLDFQKADIGKGQPSLGRIDLVQLVTRRKMMFDSLAQNRNIQLISTFTPSAYTTAVDESMMEKVIDNLISNAIKYSNPDSCVRILFDGGLKSWTLEVIDQGIGISRKAQKKLFREFYRSENAVNSNIVGSGIGLLLVKTYVELHGGSVRCISRENKGSSFKIVVPFREAPEKRNVIIDKATSSLAGETGKKEMRILVVEDNDDLRNFMLRPLSEKFKVSTAEDGAQAWEIIQKQSPDLVISDVIMPNKDGFELCEQMKSTFETAHIPLILLTTLTGKAEQLQGLGLGADDYLTKPFDMTLLIRRIESIIRNRKILREKALKLIAEKHDEPVLSNELNDKFVKKAVETVRTNMSDSKFGKDEFASAMNVSASLLYKKIKALTDQSPTDFIKSIRMNHALELLQSHKYTVTEISELCGFSSIGYFSSVFKNYFGKTPTGL
jgi:signal transduction histidine kinase/DNA-binding response OmpR family regulator/ligand-binding sensor domain-containing protein